LQPKLTMQGASLVATHRGQTRDRGHGRRVVAVVAARLARLKS
jgi:hypothetical protein